MAHGSKDYRKAARGNKMIQERIFTLGYDGYTEQEKQRKANVAARKKSQNNSKGNNPKGYADWDD